MSIRHRDTEIQSGLYAEWVADSDKLVIGFRGLNPGKNLRFHFVDVTNDIPINKVYLRDSEFVWYHHGIAGYTKTVDETAELLAGFIAERGIKRVVSVGVSGGGYAALLFGWLLEFDHVIAVSPQTCLGSGTGIETYAHGLRFLDNLAASDRAQREYFDLAPLLGITADIKSEFHVHYSEDQPEDRFHAERVRGLPGVKLHAYQEGAHRLALHMARGGVLRSLLMDALATKPIAP